MPESFSDRQGYRSGDVEIVVREDAPADLRYGIPQIARILGMSFTSIREVVCRTLLVLPDPGNWSEIPNVRDEVNYLVGDCPWFKVYDIAEALHDDLRYDCQEEFAKRLNQFFAKEALAGKWLMVESSTGAQKSLPNP